MSEHRITVMPSGHEFHALEQETLLEAALRSGLNIDFSCASGSCGDCHARLIAGRLGSEDHHDYRFTAAEQAQGMFLLCTAHAAADLVIEAGEAKSPSDIPRQKITTRIHKIEPHGDGMRILQLKTPRSKPLRFLAGQHVELSLPGTGAIDLSIGSCPCNGSQLQFHIPYGEHPFIQRLYQGLRYGTPVELEGPFGQMTLDDDSPRPLLMVAQGHELAAMKSLIEHAINLDLGQAIRFIWLARQGEHYMKNHCRSWGEALDDYRFVPLSVAANATDEEQAAQVIGLLGDEIETPGEWDIYWAGSSVFNLVLEQGLLTAGADAGRLFFPHRRAKQRSPGWPVVNTQGRYAV